MGFSCLTVGIGNERDVDLLQAALAQLLDEDGPQEAGTVCLVIQAWDGQAQDSQPRNEQELRQTDGVQPHGVAAHGNVHHLQRIQDLQPPQFLQQPRKPSSLYSRCCEHFSDCCILVPKCHLILFNVRKQHDAWD